MFEHDAGNVHLLAHHSTVLFSGDSISSARLPGTRLDQTESEDARRWADLTWDIEDGSRHRSFHRLDRLAAQWRPGDWSVTFGRQAVSWGSGIVFQPLDLFSPFAPTVIDRDYKAGNDLLLIERLLSNGDDLQVLHVVRRDDASHVTGAASSTALKWHGYASALEFEWVAAEHYDETVLGASVRIPVGQALLRADLVATRLEDDGWKTSGVVNLDVTFTVKQRNAYVYAEYFHNAWGVSRLPPSPVLLPPDLIHRLDRGEVFNLMRDYLAVGTSLEWHALLTQSTSVITNLHDSSSLLQVQFTYQPGDHHSVDVGWIEPLGAAGDEFGGVPLLGDTLTTGGASRAYVRWAWYL